MNKNLRMTLFQGLTLFPAYVVMLFGYDFIQHEAMPDLLFLSALYFVINLSWISALKWLLILGFLLDVALGYYFATHALSYTITILIVLRYQKSIQAMNIWHQTFSIAIFALIQKVILMVVLMICYGIAPYFWFLIGPIAAFILWPWVTLLMSWLRLKLNLYHP